MKKVSAAIICVGLAGVGAYLEINHQSATFVWIGAVIAFLVA
jgi:hypothetical protein